MSRPRPRRRAAVVWIVVLAALAVVAVFAVRRVWGGEPGVATLVEPLERGTFLREVAGTGVIEPVRERALAFANGGTVADVQVAEGDDVRAGDVLARLDTASLERDLASVRSSLASARADRDRLAAQQPVDRLDVEASVASAEDQVARSRRSVEDAARDLDVVRQLFDAGAASRDEVRAAEAALDVAQRALAQAELGRETAQRRLANLDQLAAAQRAAAAAQVAQLEANAANLEARLEDTTIVAPFDGVVTSVNVEPGDLVATQPVLAVADTSLLRVNGRFDETRAAELEVGQPATIVPDADTRRRLTATVVRIAPVASRESGAAQVTAELAFTPEAVLEPAYARPGSTVTVRVQVREIVDALLVPLEAITETGGAAFVYVVDAVSATDGTARRVPVTVLERNPTLAAVRADLAPGDLIAVIGLDELSDGASVTFPALVPAAGDDGG